MAKPLSTTTWSTDANIASGTETGTPTKVDPGAGYRAQGGVPGLSFVVPYWNFVINLLCQWVVYLDGITTDSQFLGSLFAWTGTHTWASTIAVTGNVQASSEHTYSPAKVVVRQLPLFSAVPITGTGWGLSTSTGIAFWQTTAGTGQNLFLPVHLPHGASITNMRACMFSSGGDAEIHLEFNTVSTTTAGAASVAASDTAGPVATIGMWTASVAKTVSAAAELLYIRIQSGATTTQVYWVEITYSITNLVPA